jgi:hypothetical protein
MKLRYSRRSPLAQQSCWRYRQGTAINVILWGSANIKMSFVGAPQTESDRRDWRARELKERLEAEFLAKLTAGSLQASGLVWPIGLNARRRTIPAARWHMLTPDFTTSEATGGGLRIVDIRVQESRSDRSRSSRATPANERVPRGHASLARLRTELRRWLQREAHSRGMTWQKKHYCSAARKKVWRPGDQQPVQRGLAIG